MPFLPIFIITQDGFRMPGQVVWKIAAPMVGLGVFLLGLGVFAAWNVHKQQQATSEMIAREVYGMLAVTDLHLEMREIRYQVNLFLRTRDPRHLRAVSELEPSARGHLEQASGLIRNDNEHRLIAKVSDAFEEFDAAFKDAAGVLLSETEASDTSTLRRGHAIAALTNLSDEILTHGVLSPLRETLEVNQQVLDRMNEASRVSARHLVIGFLLLGICGGAAGLLMGTAIARTIGKSIVQLIVSVRGVAGKLSDVRGPVTFSHVGDLSGIESSLLAMEQDIASVVQRLQQSESELLRSEQLARVGQLAAGLAHELRNPLMPMKMLVQSAIARNDGRGLDGRALRVIDAEISRLEESIQSFLDFARPPLPEKTLVDLRDLVRPALTLVSARAEQQHVTLRSHFPDAPVPACVDRGQMRQLLLNLLLNAIDALPEGGEIDVTVDPYPDGIEDVANNFSARFPNEWLALRVADSGRGIPDGMLDSVFEPFVTTKDSGTGLGLSICSRIASAHGGRLSVRNRPASGAEFALWLPRSLEA